MNRLLSISNAAVVGTFAVTTPAYAAADWKVGYWCWWSGNGYTGDIRGSSLFKYNATNTSGNDTAESAMANGKSCRATRFYVDEYSGSYFTLFSKTLEGRNYQDPRLTNGAGFDGAGVDFHDKITTVQFLGCV